VNHYGFEGLGSISISSEQIKGPHLLWDGYWGGSKDDIHLKLSQEEVEPFLFAPSYLHGSA